MNIISKTQYYRYKENQETLLYSISVTSLPQCVCMYSYVQHDQRVLQPIQFVITNMIQGLMFLYCRITLFWVVVLYSSVDGCQCSVFVRYLLPIS